MEEIYNQDLTGMSIQTYSLSTSGSGENENKYRNQYSFRQLQHRTSAPPHFIFTQKQEIDVSKPHDRLYMHGIEKAKKQARAMKIRMQEKQNIPEPKLELATRYYTPTRSRGDDSHSIHERLYKIGREKASIKHDIDEYLIKMKKEAAQSAAKTVTGSDEKIIGRLYQRSETMREEGRAKREMIEQKLSPRAQTPSRKISVDRATDFYRRSMAYKAERERRLDEAKEKQFDETIRSRSTMRSSSRARSQTPTASRMRMGLSKTESRDSKFHAWRSKDGERISAGSSDSS